MQAWLVAVLVGCILAAGAEPEKIHMLHFNFAAIHSNFSTTINMFRQQEKLRVAVAVIAAQVRHIFCSQKSFLLPPRTILSFWLLLRQNLQTRDIVSIPVLHPFYLSSRPLGQLLVWARPRCRLLAHSHLELFEVLKFAWAKLSLPESRNKYKCHSWYLMQFLWKKVNLHYKFSPSRHPSFCHKAVHGLFLFPCLLFDHISIVENVMMATLTCWIWMRRLIGLILCPPSPPCSPFFTSTCCTKKSEVILSSTAWWFKLSRELLPWSGSCSFSSPAATSWSSAAGWVGPQKPQEGADVVD